MLDLDNQIARLELRAEQMAIHLQDLGRNAPDASSARSELYAILQKLAELKSERRRRNAMLAMGTANHETLSRRPLPKPRSAARSRGIRVH
jgi:hypothetical protein